LDKYFIKNPFILSIQICEYDKKGNLKGPLADSHLIKTLCLETIRVKPNNFLINDATKPCRKDDFWKYLRRARTKIETNDLDGTPNDAFMLFLGGHGDLGCFYTTEGHAVKLRQKK